jgi:hypothetical protein
MKTKTMNTDCWGLQGPDPQEQIVGSFQRAEALKLVPSRVVAPRSFFVGRQSRIELRCGDHEVRLLLELL